MTLRLIDDVVREQAESPGFDDKQAVREKICREIINTTHEDGAWYRAMQTAMKNHRRSEFPCLNLDGEDTDA